MALVRWNNISISRNCISRMHGQCTDAGCECACGCINGSPQSLMTARRSSACTNGNHLDCAKQSGASCPCNCHKENYISKKSWLCYTAGAHSINAVDKISGNPTLYNKWHRECESRGFASCTCSCHLTTGVVVSIPKIPAIALNTPINAPIQVTPMSLNTGKANYKDAVMRLAPISEEIKRVFFLEQDIPFIFVGETVRDSLYKGIVDKYVVEFNINVDKKYVVFIEKHLNTFKDTDGNYELDTKYGKVKIVLADENTLSYWNCDWYTYDLARGITKTSSKVNLLESNNALALVDNGSKYIPYAKEVLQQGALLAQKYGWTIEEASVKRLADSIKFDQPVENTHELVIGFRSYNLSYNLSYNPSSQYNGLFTLRGSHSPWPSESLSVDCPDFVTHIKEVGEDWRGRVGGKQGQHDCGIYVYKDPSECLFHYGMSDKGDVKNQSIAIVYCWGVFGEFEKGYRVQHCEIQKMWIWDKDKRLTNDYNIPEIISGAEFSDFLYDAEVKQVAEMNLLKKGNN